MKNRINSDLDSNLFISTDFEASEILCSYFFKRFSHFTQLLIFSAWNSPDKIRGVGKIKEIKKVVSSQFSVVYFQVGKKRRKKIAFFSIAHKGKEPNEQDGVSGIYETVGCFSSHVCHYFLHFGIDYKFVPGHIICGS